MECEITHEIFAPLIFPRKTICSYTMDKLLEIISRNQSAAKFLTPEYISCPNFIKFYAKEIIANIIDRDFSAYTLSIYLSNYRKFLPKTIFVNVIQNEYYLLDENMKSFWYSKYIDLEKYGFQFYVDDLYTKIYRRDI